MIAIDQFVESMAARLVGFDPKNVVTPALRKAWSQIGAVLNEQIYGEPTDARWPVVPAELAVGKSLSIKVFASMMPLADHPGLLVVVNRQVEADAMATTINLWAGAEIAKSYHRDTKDIPRGDLRPLAKFPILVICHRRLEMSLDQGTDRFEALFTFGAGRRKSVLIDESLEMVYMAAASDGELRRLLAALPARLHVPHREAFDILENLLRVMRYNAGSSRRLTADQLLDGTPYAPAEAQRHVENLWKAVSIDQRVDTKVRRDFDVVVQGLAAGRALRLARDLPLERDHRREPLGRL